ncbi:patatin family protein [Christensenellaceae bacterium OttesenSCG-928-K19]|nr:patatin family protein [Christensenellaceae bacterium OttesenSCG-928-K19]
MTGIIDVGGGMRGVYSAGIYDYLLDHKIEFDYGLGISAGAANMISYLAKQKGRNKRFYTDYILRKEYMGMGNFFKRKGYLDLNYIYGTLSNSNGEDPVDYPAFCQTKTKYLVAATDAQTGTPHYFSNRDVRQDQYDILKASSALPIACKPFPVDDRLYFDGGIAEPIPYQKAFADGCTRLVVILTRPRDSIRSMQSNFGLIKLLLRKYPNTIRAISERHLKYNNAVAALKKLETEGKVLIAAPKDISGMKTLTKDLQAIEKLYTDGYNDGKKIAAFVRA